MRIVREATLGYILPLIIILFAINAHYYQLYLGKFNELFRYVHPSFQMNKYAEIQSKHPYADLYAFAEKNKNSTHSIIFAPNEYSRKGTSKSTRIPINELGVMVNYFFYPRIIPMILLKDLDKQKLQTGDTIITDIPINPGDSKTYELQSLVVSKEEYDKIDKTSRDAFYIYQITGTQ